MRTVAALILALVLSATICAPVMAVDNPFVTPRKGATEQTVSQEPPSPLVRWTQPVMGAIVSWQLTLRQAMSEHARNIREDPWGRSFWLFMGMAFLYGALHALGPGHGKILAVSYFLTNRSRKTQGMAFGYLTMVVHVLSAMALVLGGTWVLSLSASRSVDQLGAQLEYVSYGLLLVLGVGLLIKSVRGLRRPVEPRDRAGGSFWLMALAAGMVPCPGASLVLIFSISLNILFAGILAMVAISLGMGLTIGGCAVAAIAGRDVVGRFLERHARSGLLAFNLVSLAGACCITVLGALLLFGKLYG